MAIASTVACALFVAADAEEMRIWVNMSSIDIKVDPNCRLIIRLYQHSTSSAPSLHAWRGDISPLTAFVRERVVPTLLAEMQFRSGHAMHKIVQNVN